MGDFRLSDGMSYELAGQVEASTTGTTVTTSGSANTKGAWSQLIAATARDATGINVFLGVPSSGTFHSLFDIGVGASGSEQVVLPNLMADGTAGVVSYFFPVSIPAGTRLAARAQAGVGAITLFAYCLLVEEGLAAPCAAGRVTDYGTSTAASTGTTVTSSGSANTKGAWTQLTASTTNQTSDAFVALASEGILANFMIDVAVGAGGSEQIVAGDLPLFDPGAGSSETMFTGLPLPLSIPAGSRIAARSQDSLGGGNVCYVAVYGIE